MPILIIFLLLAHVAYAEPAVYQSADQHGNIIYSDQPHGKNTKLIAIPAENIMPATKLDQRTDTTIEINRVVSEKKEYQSFLMISPSNEETFQNQPNIKVSLRLDPPLQEGDTIQVYLDGKPWGKPSASSEFEFVRPDRGTHVIYAALLDHTQSVLKKTTPYTIYVHQAHLGRAGSGM